MPWGRLNPTKLVIRINQDKPVLQDSLQGRKPGEQVDSGDHCLRH